jgi:pyruvate formate lyase activating enzyme
MRIGGFLKQSLIDWEGMIAAVIFTKGCNFRCGYCHNPSLVLPDFYKETEETEIEEILSYLSTHKNWIDGVVISGGEPTIHSDLPNLIKAIRQAGYSIKLDTNGSNPLMIEGLISGHLVDFVAMDIKTVLQPAEYARITNCQDTCLIEKIVKSVNILRESRIQYQFRTTLVPTVHTEEIVEYLKKKFKSDPWIQQQYRQGITIDSFTDLKLPLNS